MNKFLTCVLFLVGIISVYAQESCPKLSPIKTGVVMHLYNLNARGFLVGGNNYNTEASLSDDHANKVVLKEYLVDGKWDGETYYITDSVELGGFRGTYRNLFIENNKKIFVDQDENGGTRDRDNLWRIVLVDTIKQTYHIMPSEHNKWIKYPGKQLGSIYLDVNNLPVVTLLDDSTKLMTCEWAFVAPVDKDNYCASIVKYKQQQKAEYQKRLTAECLVRDDIPTEEIMYLYNYGYEGFLIGGNAYNTQASLSKEYAYKIKLHKYIEQGGEWDGKSYLITDSVESCSLAGSYRNLFIDSGMRIWVDQQDNSHLDCVWEITRSLENNIAYTIRPSHKNKVFNKDNLPDFVLASTFPQDYRNHPIVTLFDGVVNKGKIISDWCFLSENQYIKYNRLKRIEQLRSLLEQAKKITNEYDFTATCQICNDMNASDADINDAIGRMRAILLSKGDVNEDIDFTQLLKNPNFDMTNGYGWERPFDVENGSITWVGGDPVNYCAEAYQAIYEFSQQIVGIPNGLYRIDAQAFYRSRGVDLAWIERDSTFVVPTIFGNEYSVPVLNLMHTTFSAEESSWLSSAVMNRTLNNYSTPLWKTMDNTYVLHNMRVSSLAFSKGLFNQSLYAIVNDGTINLGIKSNKKKTGCWTAWDNFRITYLAETKDNYVNAINSYIDKANETVYLERIKGVDDKALAQVVEEAQHMSGTANVTQWREMLSVMNKELIHARELLEKKEFAESGKIIYNYSDILEESEDDATKEMKRRQKSRQDSISHILDDANSYFNMGQLFLNQNTVLAQKHFLTSFDYFISVPYDPQNKLDDCVATLSDMYISREQNDKAIDIWKRRIDALKKSTYYDIENKLADAYWELGCIYMYRTNQNQPAEESFRKGAEIAERLYEMSCKSNKEDKIKENKSLLSRFSNLLAYSLAYQEKYDDALKTINRAIELSSDDPNLYDSRGEILYMKGDKEGARAMWEKVISLDPEFATKNDSQLFILLFGK